MSLRNAKKRGTSLVVGLALIAAPVAVIVATAPAAHALTCQTQADDWQDSRSGAVKGQGIVGCDAHVSKITVDVLMQKCRITLDCTVGSNWNNTTTKNSNSCPNSPTHCQATATGPVCQNPVNYWWRAKVTSNVTNGGTTTTTRYSQYPYTQCV